MVNFHRTVWQLGSKRISVLHFFISAELCPNAKKDLAAKLRCKRKREEEKKKKEGEKDQKNEGGFVLFLWPGNE